MLRSAIAGLLAIAAALPALPAAEAANPPRVRGESCGALAAQIGKANVWSTSFYGERKDLFDRIEFYQAAPCFRSQADCKAWLYWAQTDWNHYNYWNPCRKGR
jgi:hypothetical protein